MSIFRKLTDILGINIRSKAEEANNPEDSIELMIMEMQEALVKATSSMSEVLSSRKKLQKQYHDLLIQAEDCESRARELLKNGDEAGARRELVKKASAKKNAVHYKKLSDEADQTATTIETRIIGLKAKLEEAITEKAVLISRGAEAEARKEFAKKEAGLGVHSFTDFEKLREKVEMQEIEADVQERMSNEDYEIDKALGDDIDLESEIRELKKGL